MKPPQNIFEASRTASGELKKPSGSYPTRGSGVLTQDNTNYSGCLPEAALFGMKLPEI